MATNRDLLKEAIADAKAVKDMAIANAKAALEESFTPQLKSMLSAKLQEMEEEDLDEAGFGSMDPEGHGNIEDESSLYEMEEETMDEDLDLNELLSELNEEEEEEMDAEEEEMDAEEGEPLDLEDMTDEDLKKFIEDVIADMVEAGELEAGEGEEEEGEEAEEGEEMEDEEEVNLDELLDEIEMMEGDDEEEVMEEGFMDKIVKFVTRESGKIKEKIDQMPVAVRGGIKRGELPSGYQPSETEISTLVAQIKDDGGLGEYYAKDNKLTYRPAKETKGSSQASTFENLQTELEEAYNVIKTLRSELNEVNLLNAKLLYTNKIFKAKNLTESQKVNVLGMFDKAGTVKEVKLVFETLSEGLKSKPTTNITEGMGSASKTLGTTKTKQPIVESNDMVARFQKLAGIIKD